MADVSSVFPSSFDAWYNWYTSPYLINALKWWVESWTPTNWSFYEYISMYIYIEYYIVFEYVLIWKTAYMLQMFEPCPLHGWKSAQFRDISTRNLNERPWKYRTTVPISQPLWNDHGLSMSKLKWNLCFPAIVKPDPLLWRISHLVVSNGTR